MKRLNVLDQRNGETHNRQLKLVPRYVKQWVCLCSFSELMIFQNCQGALNVVTLTDAPVIARKQHQMMVNVSKLITLATVSSNLLVCIHIRIEIGIQYFLFCKAL